MSEPVSENSGTGTADIDRGGAPPARRAPAWLRWTVIAVAFAVVVALVVVAPTGWRVFQQRDTTLSTPDRLAGLVREQGPSARDTAEFLQAAIAAEIDLDTTVGAVYSGNVIVAGGTGLLWSPESALDRLFTLVADDAGGVTGVGSYPPGPLGGVLKCGRSTVDTASLAVCGWADHGSVVISLLTDRAPEDCAGLLREMRAGMQRR